MAAHCQQQLCSSDIDPVPLDGLHLTLPKVGDAAVVERTELRVVANAAEEALAAISSFELSVGPLAGSMSALRFSVAPWDRLFGLHAQLRESVVSVRPAESPKPASRFRPHIGIGYSNRRRPAAPIIEAVAALREIEPVKVRVEDVKLVRLWRTDHRYEWDEIATIQLR
ncbi:2'-5' RNA ligase family protein [Nocardia asteroides]|uniref:2'-5' RNA ligase family protein n=1 Tax=Nocardia asteroides TaxID=1824 RepID=UPI003B3AA09D